MNPPDADGQRAPAEAVAAPPGDARALRRSMTLVTAAGSLYMVFAAGVTSPSFTEFFRSLGATEFTFGLLGAIPAAMLALQFVGALLTNRIRRRKPFFMTVHIASRLLYLPLALCPLLLPQLPPAALLLLPILLLTASNALGNLVGPLGMSWVADLVPADQMNRFWGHRQRWMHAVWVVSFLAVAGFTYLVRLPPRPMYAALAAVGVCAGVADIVLFRWVIEPPNAVTRGKPVVRLLLEPFRHAQFRSFLTFSCAWSGVAMFAASFMQLYVLQELGVPVWETTLIFCMQGIGMALSSAWWGRVADRYGQKPVFKICLAMKPLIVLAYLFATPENVAWLLGPMFLIDAVWNAGLGVATNGYMLKMAPRENRTMYIAALSALAAIASGLGALLGGTFLHLYRDFAFDYGGRRWTNYHVLFFVNFMMRIATFPLVFRIREPASATAETVLNSIQDIWPMRILLFPLNVYLRIDDRLAELMDRGERK